MRLLTFTISKTFLALLFVLLVQRAAGQLREDIFGGNDIGKLEQHISKKELLQQTQDALVQLKLKAIKANDHIMLARSLYDLMQIQDARTEDTLYFRNSAFMDTLLNDKSTPAQLKAIIYVLHARRLNNFDGLSLKFNKAAYQLKNMAIDYASLGIKERDSIENNDLEAALITFNFEGDASRLLWLSSNPGIFLFTPSFRDIVLSEDIYQAANKYYRYSLANRMNNRWPSLPSAAFRPVLDSIANSPLARESVLAKYRKWMLFHKSEPGVQLFIESLARKYVFLSIDQDTASRKAYINYLFENTSSQSPEFAAHVTYQLCLLWNEDGNKYVNFTDRYQFLTGGNFINRYQYMPQKALGLYLQNKALIDKFPVLSGVLELMKRQILKSGVRVEMQDSFTPGTAVPFKAIYKNAHALYYRVVPIGANEPVTDRLGKVMGNLLSRKAAAEGKFVLPLPDDHNYHAAYLKLDSLTKGHYALLFGEKEITAADSGVSSIAFQVTGVAAVNTDERVYVLDRKTGAPLAGATVEMDKNKVAADGRPLKVNDAGYVIAPEEKADSLTIVYRGDTLGYKFNVQTNKLTDDIYDKDAYDDLGDFYDDKLTMQVFTDRAIYRPGQTVQYKIIFLTKDPLTGAPILFTGQNVNSLFKNRLGNWLKKNKAKIVLNDPFSRAVDSVKLTINDFGSFAGSFAIPKNAATGDWRIEGTPETDNHNNGDFRVEEYKRPTIELSMQKQQKMLKPGQTFAIKLKLRSFTGADLGNIPITYSLNRNGRLPVTSHALGEGSYADVKLADTTGYTDSNGELSIPVNDTALARYPITDEDILYYTYNLHAKAVDATGESTDISERIDISSRPIKIVINAAKVYDRQAMLPLNVRTNADFEGEVPRKVAVKLYRVSNPDASGFAMREVDQWYYDQQQWNAWFPNLAVAALNLKPERTLILDTIINTGLYQKLVLPKDKLTAGFYHLDAVCRDSGKVSAQTFYEFKVFDSASGEVPADGIDYMAANSAKPGETVNWYTSSKNDNYAVYLALYEAGAKKRKIQAVYKEIKEQKGLCRCAFQVPADAVGDILLTRISVFNNKLTEQKTTVYLVRPQNDPPEIIIEKYRKVMAPGAQETFSLSIKTKNENVAAELMTTLYDASLDKLEQLQWSLPGDAYDRTYLRTNWGNLSYPRAAGDYGRTEPEYLTTDGPGRGERIFDMLQGRAAGVEVTDASGLQDVVVVGYGTVRSKDLTGSVVSVMIRGTSSLADYKQPLIVIDGVVYTGDLSKIPVGSITQGIVLKGADAAAIYGARAAEGVLILSTKGPIVLPNINEEPVIKIRKNFNETAFFFPQVHADSAGYYHFSFTMPETATEWNWKIMAHTRDARFAYVERKLQTRMNLMVQPNMPRLLYQGDKLKLESRISNLDTAAISGTVTCKIEDAVTGQDVTSMLVANAKQPFSLAKKSSGAAAFWLNVPAAQTNPLKVIITVAGPGASDGEEHILPVLSSKIFTRQSAAVHFKDAPSLTVSPVKLPADAELYGIGISIQQKPQAALINALPWLANYSYDCAEQTFNKLRAKVAAIRLMETDTVAQHQYKKALLAMGNTPVKDELLPDELAEAAMPWLNLGNQTKTSQKQLLHLLDTINTGLEIDRHLEKLYKLQQADGGLAWFDGGRSNDYISAYVLAGFGQLKRLGWKPGSNMATRYDAFLQRLVKYDRQQVVMAATTGYDAFDLYALSYWQGLTDQPAGFGVKIDSLLARKWVWQNTSDKDLEGQALLIINTLRYTKTGSREYQKALQQLTNIRQLAIEDGENGLRWKDIADAEELGESAEETIALLAEAFEAAGNYNGINSGIIKWLLATKQDQHWQTTKATAAAIDMLQKEKGSAIGEDKVFSADINGQPITVSDGLLNGAPSAFTALAQPPVTINLTQQGKNADGAISWYYFTRTQRLDTLNKGIKISKQFYRYSKEGSMIALKTGDSIKVGEDVRVTLTIETASRLKFVHITDPRAAAFEPKDSKSGYRDGDGIDYYQSVKDTGLELFAESVPRGITTISYDVVAAMTGDFTSGPAHLQCMYQPSAAAYSDTRGFSVK